MEWVAGHGATEERQTRVLSGFPSVSLRVFGYRLLPCPVWCRHLRTPPRDGHVPQKSAATCAPDWRVLPSRPSPRSDSHLLRTCRPWLLSHCLPTQAVRCSGQTGQTELEACPLSKP